LKWEEIVQKTNSPKIPYLTWAEIDLKAVRHNLKQIVKLSAKNKFYFPTRPPQPVKINQGLEFVMAVIKANAYGHGMEKIGLLLDKAGVGFFCVSDINEGIALRKIGIKKSILLLESTLASDAQQIADYQLVPTICTLGLAASLNRYAQKKKRRIDVHVKVDTGMGRLGVWHEEAFDFIKKVSTFKCLRIMGIFTHFPAADTDRSFTRQQLKYLYDLVKRLDRSGLIVPYIHAANSMGLVGYPTHIVNLARPGLMLYGLYPHLSLCKKIHLKPVLNVRSRVIFLKKIKRGRSVSYGRTFFTKKDMLVATVPIGYNDGYFRALSNQACVLIDGTRCPVIGRVTMDQIMVDVSRVKKVQLGSSVTVLGAQKKENISADELAKLAGTINYEIVCSLGNRLPKIYK
jgi:alanine racemase